jgi:hypothetical protein
VHAPDEEKSNDSKDNFCEQVFDHFPKYHMKILLGDLNTKFGREDIFNWQVGVSLHQDSTDNDVGIRIIPH